MIILADMAFSTADPIGNDVLLNAGGKFCLSIHTSVRSFMGGPASLHDA